MGGKTINRKICLIFLAVLFLIGFLNMKYYPVNYDDVSEKRILWKNIMTYSQVLHMECEVPDLVAAEGLLPIHEDVERDHGVALLYPYAMILGNSGISDYTKGLAWNCCIYLVFCASTVYMFFLVKILFGKVGIALIGSSMYFLAPRFYADSLHNNKDIVLAALLVVMTYYLVSMIKAPGMGKTVGFVVSAAFCCNIRVIGFFFAGAYGLAYAFILSRAKKGRAKNCLRVLMMAFFIIAFYVIITPATFGTGRLHLIEHIRYCLERAAHFNGWYAPILFSGKVYNPNIENLPWYYIPKLILISTPPVVLLLFVMGVIFLVLGLSGKDPDPETRQGDLITVFVLFTLSSPLLVAVIKGALIYNGWRHFYFLYVGIVLTACAGISHLMHRVGTSRREKLFQKALTAIAAVTILLYWGGDLYWQVGGTAYYNLFAGKNVHLRYEMDYYGATGKEILRRLSPGEDGPVTWLLCDGFSSIKMDNALPSVPDKEKERIRLLHGAEEMEQYRAEEGMIYEYIDPVYALWDGDQTWKRAESMKTEYLYRPWGNIAGAVYRVNDGE